MLVLLALLPTLLYPSRVVAERARVLGAAAAAPFPGALPPHSTSGTAGAAPLAAFREPAALAASAVPAALAALSGLCFGLDSTPSHRYSYEFCPFRNVSQREQPQTWSSFYGLLGLWEGWVPPANGTAEQQLVGLYSDGTECGMAKQRRVARVQWLCSRGGAYVLKGVQEPRQCEYRLTFASPEACSLVPSSAPQQSAASGAPSGSLPPSSAPPDGGAAAAAAPAPSAAAAAAAAAAPSAPAPAPAPTPAAPPAVVDLPVSATLDLTALSAAAKAPAALDAGAAAAPPAHAAAAPLEAMDAAAVLLAVLEELKDIKRSTRLEFAEFKEDLMRSTRELLRKEKATTEGISPSNSSKEAPPAKEDNDK